MELRYGENPHQGGAVYATDRRPRRARRLPQLQGKELSWNNLLDADAARKIVALFDEPAVVIVKHNNPCGVGRGADLAEAYGRALATDPVSAFGWIVALNRPADGALAEAMADLFVEVLLAPGFDDGGAGALRARRRTCGCWSARLPAHRRSEIELRADRRRLPRPAAGRAAGRSRRLDLPAPGGSRPQRSAAPWSSPGRSAAT